MRERVFLVLVAVLVAGLAAGQDTAAIQEGVGSQVETVNSGSPDSIQLAESVEMDTLTDYGNSFARGVAVLLRHAGCQTDYATVMGDLGQAFILQGAEYDKELTGGYADLGWWPLDGWHVVSQLPFLSLANGLELDSQAIDRIASAASLMP